MEQVVEDEHGYGESDELEIDAGEGQPIFTQNFSSIQSRKFRRATVVPCWALCPSMDLVALGSGSAQVKINLDGTDSDGTPESEISRQDTIEVAETISVHRIVSWQRILVLNSSELTTTQNNDTDCGRLDDDQREDHDWDVAEDGGGPFFGKSEIDEVGLESPNKEPQHATSKSNKTIGATSICWSPDGRCTAIGLVDGGVLIHNVEPGAAESVSLNGSSGESARHCALHVIRPPLLPGFTSSTESEVEISSRPMPISPKVETRRKYPFSPRVTRSMTAARLKKSAEILASEKSTANYEALGNKKAGRERQIKEGEQAMNKIMDKYASAVVGMTWHRISPRHPSWQTHNREWEKNQSWKFCSQLIDRGHHFLPTGTKENNSIAFQDNTGWENNDKSENGHLNFFSSLAPLNVLCVATRGQNLHWYLHGRYRILSISQKNETNQIHLGPVIHSSLVSSPDLSTLLVISERDMLSISPQKTVSPLSPMTVTLFSIPLLVTQRFDLQILSASYQSIFSRLREVKKGLQSSLKSWQSALRPLDTKFSGLNKLLRDYSVSSFQSSPDDKADSEVVVAANSIRLELLRFILSGRSTVAGNTSNALDQFFTRPQMHDQLFQRAARGVEASVASMEGNLRSNVLSHVKAILYEAQELYGLARTRERVIEDFNLFDVSMALRLYTSSRILFLVTKQCLSKVVEARSRLHDLLAWIRGTASQVRARGTASDSVQRQNARERRVPNGVLQRVGEFLSSPAVAIDEETSLIQRQLTECIIGVPISDFFVRDYLCPKTEIKSENRKTKRAHTLKSSLQLTFRAGATFFDQPRATFARSVQGVDVTFENHHSLLAAHTRIGLGSVTFKDKSRGDGIGFFAPKTCSEQSTIQLSHYWMLMVRSFGSDSNLLELIAVPGQAIAEYFDSNISADQSSVEIQRFCLRAILFMEKEFEVLKIGFYSDDGNSSLSPNLNVDAELMEGRQSLGMIVRCSNDDNAEELWVFPYDDVSFSWCNVRNDSKSGIVIPAAETSTDARTLISVSELPEVMMNNAQHTILPKRRRIRNGKVINDDNRKTLVSLCGSRGIGGVVSYGASTSLDLFDIEEDEDDASELESECTEE